MIKLWKENYFFFSGFLLYLLLGVYWLNTQEKGDMVLWLNGKHTPFWDRFFVGVTFLGDGIFYGIVIVIFLFRKYADALMFLIGFLLTTLFAQGLKNTIFAGMPRPRAYFSDDNLLHFAEGITVHAFNSFPSGHSTSAFSVFCLLALWSRKPLLGIMFLFFAILATLSRIYLAQHFFVDTYFGAIFGVLSSMILYNIFQNSPKFQQKKWQKSLLNR